MTTDTDTQRPAEIIEQATAHYATTRDELKREVEMLRELIKAAQDARRSQLIALLDQAANARTDLEQLLLANRSLFARPKTRQLHGIKVGFRKMPGQVRFADDEALVIQRIREHLRGKAKQLIQTRETVRKDALAELPAAELASIGVSIVEVAADVVIRAIDSDLDRLIKGLAGDDDFGRDIAGRAL